MIQLETTATWTTNNPIITIGVIAVSSDTGKFKIGNGSSRWADLIYSNTISTLCDKDVSVTTPLNNSILLYSNISETWYPQTHGLFETGSELISQNSIFPTFTLAIELNDTTLDPTGRFKIGNGVDDYITLPWAGWPIDITTFPTGYSLEFNGTYFEAANYIKLGDGLQSATPSGYLFARDDGIWASPGGDYIESIPVSVDKSILAFYGVDGKHIIDTGIDYTNLVPSHGTPSEYFQIHTVNGPRIYDVGGELHIKTSDGLLYNHLRAASVYGEYATFTAIVIGEYPSEETSISLTTDGTCLYVDGAKVVSTFTDGHGSDSDADTLDAHHASYFATYGDLDVVKSKALIYSTIMGV